MADGPNLTELLEAQSSYRVRALLNEPAEDTTDPVARDWLERWGPSGIRPRPPSCSCTKGHCHVCN